ncbi:hypothetical protein TRVL_10307 [Trypanosoma vivax]|nr:hypothetical protein TRVL_10307 [Trypanosoma vivax]
MKKAEDQSRLGAKKGSMQEAETVGVVVACEHWWHRFCAVFFGGTKRRTGTRAVRRGTNGHLQSRAREELRNDVAQQLSEEQRRSTAFGNGFVRDRGVSVSEAGLCNEIRGAWC